MSVTRQQYARPASADDAYYKIWSEYSSKPVYVHKAKHSGALPMNWSLRNVSQLIQEKSLTAKTEKQRAVSSSSQSRLHKLNCKEKFEHALRDERRDINQGRQRFNWRSDNTSRYNGPTRHGSPIYNQRAELLNTIRTQSARYYNDRCLVEKTALPSIRQTIEVYNRNYKLMLSPQPAALFVGKNGESPPIAANNAVNFTIVATTPRLSCASKGKSIAELEDAKIRVKPLKLEEVKTPPSSNSSQQESDKLDPEPLHWIDELSVSGDTRSSEKDLVESQKNVPIKAPVVEVKPIGEQQNLPLPVTSDIKEIASEQAVESVSKTIDNNRPPNFICPSSQEKSREHAVKTWIASSSFLHAVRTRPIT